MMLQLLIVRPATAATDVLLEVTGPLPVDVALSVDKGEAAAVAFTLGRAFSNVSISADIICVDCVGRLSLIQKMIGPGAQVTDLVAVTNFDASSPLNLLLFSGLDLDPETYFLVVAIDDGFAVWPGSLEPVITEAPDVTHLFDFWTGTVDASFAAESDFDVILDAGALHYLVVSNSTDDSDSDSDGDGIVDDSDNCPNAPNTDQQDNDDDFLGDVCDTDDDNDFTLDGVDNCPFSANPDQIDSDLDGLGDVCDEDSDGDGVGPGDNCPNTPNPDQDDTNGNGSGDACDSDDDSDGVDDNVDNCPMTVNPEQADQDNDGIGDACDADVDGDGVTDTEDNCPALQNPGQDDADQDSMGDACDSDDDNDGVPDAEDNCQFIPNADQSDENGDGRGDVCDQDIDGDGFENGSDNCPIDSNVNQLDFDGDGLGDTCDPDIDDDNVINKLDACAETALDVFVSPMTGCSVTQLCPCGGPRGTTMWWKNHGKYASCVAKTSERFLEQQLITEAIKDAIVSAAAESSCGVK